MDEPGEDGLDCAFTNRMGTIEWVRLELPAHVVLPDPPPLTPGVLLASMADLGDGDRLRHQVYELNKGCSADIPDRGEFFTYDRYEQQRFKADGFRADATVLAVAGDELVGMCAISQRPGRDWAFIEMTGVRRSHRRLGLATALKIEAIRRARGAGATVVRTIHHPDNAAIIKRQPCAWLCGRQLHAWVSPSQRRASGSRVPRGRKGASCRRLPT